MWRSVLVPSRPQGQRRAQAKGYQRHQLHDGGEQQLARTLALPVLVKHLVDPACRQRLPQRCPCYHARRRMALKPLENTGPDGTAPAHSPDRNAAPGACSKTSKGVVVRPLSWLLRHRISRRIVIAGRVQATGACQRRDGSRAGPALTARAPAACAIHTLSSMPEMLREERRDLAERFFRFRQRVVELILRVRLAFEHHQLRRNPRAPELAMNAHGVAEQQVARS